jgi:hypothetical protein
VVISSFEETITRKIWNGRHVQFQRNDRRSVLWESTKRLNAYCIWRLVDVQTYSRKYLLEMDSVISDSQNVRVLLGDPPSTKRRLRWLRSIGAGRYNSECNDASDSRVTDAISSTLMMRLAISFPVTDDQLITWRIGFFLSASNPRN